MDLRQISYFLRVVEEGNVTRAAEKLNIAQPTLSKSIKYLERQLDVQLFERLPRGVKLTIYGEKLLEHARHVEVQVTTAVDDLKGIRSGNVGNVRIGAGPSWLRRLLPEAIALVLRERPDITINVSGGFDEALLKALSAGHLDFVLAELPLRGPEPEFRAEQLTEDRLCICARAGHALQDRKNITLTELQDYQWVLPPAPTLARKKLDAFLLTHGLKLPKRVTVSDSLGFMLSLIRRSDAITYTTMSILTSEDGQGIVLLDVPAVEVVRGAGLIFRKPILVSPAVNFVADVVRRIAAENPKN
uniref:LysR family transcriptional regulator n=1 Tax=Pararhizobium sp. IMCC3301 TaxID=3067904 RepID=UPI002740E5D1|nr:LysR family transcriptional regulator [Pararhizobium sp. IMCC3301]